MATRVLLYGSCVSRDMLGYAGAGYDLIEYVARQSLISTTSHAVDLPAEPVLDSPFQRRMVIGDFASSIGVGLAGRAREIDLLVLDLVDERLGVVHVPGKGYLTRSQELLDSGLLEHFPDASSMIAFGSSEHVALWRPAAATFLGILKQTGLIDRTFMIEATFAARTDVGTSATKWWRRSARHWNKVFAPYYQVFKDAGVRTHTIGTAAIANAGHQWGPSAYHYVDQTYRDIVRSMDAFTARPPSADESVSGASECG